MGHLSHHVLLDHSHDSYSSRPRPRQPRVVHVPMGLRGRRRMSTSLMCQLGLHHSRWAFASLFAVNVFAFGDRCDRCGVRYRR